MTISFFSLITTNQSYLTILPPCLGFNANKNKNIIIKPKHTFTIKF